LRVYRLSRPAAAKINRRRDVRNIPTEAESRNNCVFGALIFGTCKLQICYLFLFMKIRRLDVLMDLGAPASYCHRGNLRACAV
jgi:hypothetical protein